MIRPSLFLAVLAVTPPALAAQAPGDIPALAAADSGRPVGEEGLSPDARRIIAGLTLLATSRPPTSTLSRAVHQFELALADRADDPWAWYGLARANLALARSGASWTPSRTRAAGLSYYEAFLWGLDQALTADPGFVPALRLLAQTVAAEPERLQPRWVISTLDAQEALAADPAAVSLVRGRLARAEGHFAEAKAEFAAYRESGGDLGLALLEVARTDAASDSLPEAAASYLSGLDSAGPIGRRAYRLDLEWIADSGELARFDATPASGLRGWATHFFETRDAEDVREPGERLREHLRRWAYVHARFTLVHPSASAAWGPGWFRHFRACLGSDSTTLEQFGSREPVDTADPRQAERVLDDRAIIYMRHGTPQRDIYAINGQLLPVDEFGGTDPRRRRDDGRLPGIGTSTSGLGPGDADEVWLYSMGGRSRAFQFVGSQQLGQQAPTTLLWFPEDPWLLEQRGLVDDEFSRLASISITSAPVVGLFCLPSAEQLETRSRVDLAVAATTDGYPLTFPFPAVPSVQVNAIAEPGDTAGYLVVAYGAPAERLAPVTVDGKVTYPLAYRLVAVDSLGRVVRRTGTVSVAARDTLGRGQYISGVLDLEVPAGIWRLGFAIAQPGGQRGGAVSAPGLRVGVDHPLDVSGLFLGQAGNEVVWSGPDRAIGLTPMSAFPRGAALDLFYQVSGLVSGEGLHTSVAVFHHDNDRIGTRVVQLGFSDVASGRETALQRAVDVSRLGIGEYLLVVTVSRADDSATVRRERAFSIVKP